MNFYVNPGNSEVFGYDDAQVASGLVAEHLKPCALLAPSIHHRWDDTSEAWEVTDLAPVRDEIWLQIKAERDRRKSAGVKVANHWFHTDDSSRIQQLGLKLFGVSVPPINWKTMSGEFVPMTEALAESIFQSVAQLDVLLFAKAEQHKAAMQASSNPASYDFSTGWPPCYGE